MRRRRTLAVALVSVIVLSLMQMHPSQVLAAACGVTTANDTGPGSLRQALTDADGNACLDPVTSMNTITFALVGTGVHTIMPSLALPTITRPMLIDGTSQPGYSGIPLIELDGVNAGNGASGLEIDPGGGGSTVRGLIINRFASNGYGIFINGADTGRADNVIIQGNYLGTDATGTVAAGNINGVYVAHAGHVTITGNVISGNLNEGIATFGGAGANTLLGNRIGADATGTAALANALIGVDLLDSGGDIVGGTSATARNLISGNGSAGISLSGGIQISPDTVEGNYIGTNATGAVALPNGVGGIRISSSNNTIGGASAGAGNLISGNHGDGVNLIAGAGNLVQGNLIGADAGGTTALGNDAFGIDIGTDGNTIGGSGIGAGNVISGNGGGGIGFNGGINNVVQGNLIGTDAHGTAALGNTNFGILVGNVMSPGDTLIGNTIVASRRNASSGIGILVSNGAATIQGNLIGTTASGANLGNAGDGIQVAGNGQSPIGGTGAGTANTVAFNGGIGIDVIGAHGIAVRGNSVHDNVHLGIDLGGDGVTLNTPGGPHSGPNNLQNYPVLQNATVSGSQTTIAGTLNSIANTTFHLDFFASPTCDPSGNGQGQIYLGSSDQTTVGTDVTFSVTLNIAMSPGDAIAATATDPNGNTSEFSACSIATGSSPTATNTQTTTSTITATATPSNTASSTSTATATATPTPTATMTSVPTMTRTATAMRSPTLTATLTSTASRTGTATSTATATLSASAIRTATATSTAMAKATDTATLTASLSPTATKSPTPTSTVALSITPTATAQKRSFTLIRYVVAGGGVTFSTGGSFHLGATSGQPTTSTACGGRFGLTSGFWATGNDCAAGAPHLILARSVVAGGGVTFSSGGPFRLGATSGQLDAGTLCSSSFGLTGGLWGNAYGCAVLGHPPP